MLFELIKGGQLPWTAAKNDPAFNRFKANGGILDKIHFRNADFQGIRILQNTLAIEPEKRITLDDLTKESWFRGFEKKCPLAVISLLQRHHERNEFVGDDPITAVGSSQPSRASKTPSCEAKPKPSTREISYSKNRGYR